MRRRGVVWKQHGLWGLLTIITFGTAVLAQVPGEVQISAPLVDASHGLRAYHLVEALLAQRPQDKVELGSIKVTGLLGVRLTLRSQGVTVGHAEVYRDDLGSDLNPSSESTDLVPLIQRVTEMAKADVRESLADANLRAILEGRSLPDPVELTVADVQSRMIVDLELAFGLEPIRVSKEADPDAVFAQFAPGYHGLAFINPTTGARGWVWPGEVLSRNISPPSQLTLGLKQVGIDRDLVTQLARPEGIPLARFHTILLVRPIPESEPTRIIRSGIDAPRYAANESQLVNMTDRLIEHIYSRFTSDHQLRGTYYPTSGRYEPPIAADEQAALACYAVMHHARYLTRARPNDQTPLLYAQRALDAVNLLDAQSQLRGGEADPRVLALALLSMLEAPPELADDQKRDRCGEQLMSLLMDVDPEQDDSPLNAGSAALSSAALACWYEKTRRPEVGHAANALIDSFWADPDKAPNIAALPWLALAQDRAGQVLQALDEGDDRAAELDRRRQAVGSLIDRLCRYQVIERPELGPDDVMGGFMLNPGPPGSPPNPDWRNAQPLMLISTVLRDKATIADHDPFGWLIAASYSARFVEQLMIEDASCYYVRDRIAAMGGVRMAPWDNRLALASSAMSLLALTELQTTLADMRAQGADVNEEPAEDQPDQPDADDPSGTAVQPE